MHWKHTRILFCILSFGMLPFGMEILAKDAVPPQPSVRIGLVTSLFRDIPEPMIHVLLAPLKSLMESQTGVSPQLACAGHAEKLAKELAEDKVQLGVFHGVEFAWARMKYPNLKPLMITTTHEPQLRALLVVNQDSEVQTFCDLKRKTVALPRRSKEHCHLFMERRCKDGTDPAKAGFARLLTPPDSEEALDNVVDGTVAAAVVDQFALNRYKELKPVRFSKLKIVQQSEPFPQAAIAYRPGCLDEAMLQRFREGLLSAHQTPRGQQLMTLCQIVGFQTVPADYDEMLTNIAKAYPPPAQAEK